MKDNFLAMATAIVLIVALFTVVSVLSNITFYERGIREGRELGYKEGQLDFQRGEIRFQLWEDGYIEYKRID